VRAERAFDYVGEAIRGLCDELHPEKGVIGFCGAPFTLAAYLVQGGPARQIDRLKALAYNQPDLCADVSGLSADVVADLLELQIAAGADMVQIFDTWAWHLSPEDYEELALPYTRRVIERLSGHDVPVVLYVRNAAGHLEAAGSSGCRVLSVDASVRLADARRRLDRSVALQGNFDPALLNAPAEKIRKQVHGAIEAMAGSGYIGYIANLGQGLTPDTPVEGVEAFVRAVRDRGA